MYFWYRFILINQKFIPKNAGKSEIKILFFSPSPNLIRNYFYDAFLLHPFMENPNNYYVLLFQKKKSLWLVLMEGDDFMKFWWLLIVIVSGIMIFHFIFSEGENKFFKFIAGAIWDGK